MLGFSLYEPCMNYTHKDLVVEGPKTKQSLTSMSKGYFHCGDILRNHSV